MFDHDRKKGQQPDAYHEYGYSTGTPPQENHGPADDVFGDEEGAQVTRTPSQHQELSLTGSQIQYRTMSWPLVAVLMIAEIISNGMLSLPSSLAVVGVVPGVIVIVFLGVFATFTSWLLIEFKLRHPQGEEEVCPPPQPDQLASRRRHSELTMCACVWHETVHSMGDAGMILFGPVGREVLAAGTIIFAVFATGSQLLAGQTALSTLSDSRLCLMLYTGIFAVPTLIFSLPRTMDRLSWLSIPAVASILVAGVVGMIGAGLHPVEGRTVDIARSSDFVTAFVSITNPVFAYGKHDSSPFRAPRQCVLE